MPNVDALQAANRQRVGFLAIVPGLIRSLGGDTAAILSAVGLEADALADPNGTISYATMGRLLVEAATQTNCPHFGLLIGEQITVASLGPLGQLMQSAPAVGVALHDFCSHQHRNAHGSIAYLLKQGEQAMFGYTVYQPRMSGVPHVYDGAAAAAYRIVKELTGQKTPSGLQVLFSRAQPSDLAPYHRFFDAPLRFNAVQTGVCFPLAWLDRPIVGADRAQRTILEQRIAAYWAAGNLDIATRLRRTLRVAMFSGQPADGNIAAQLGLQQRQLHRLLRDKGYNFKALLNELRFELAQQLLENTTLRLVEISHILGFSHQNSFSRAFIRWARIPATDWRALALQRATQE